MEGQREHVANVLAAARLRFQHVGLSDKVHDDQQVEEQVREPERPTCLAQRLGWVVLVVVVVVVELEVPIL